MPYKKWAAYASDSESGFALVSFCSSSCYPLHPSLLPLFPLSLNNVKPVHESLFITVLVIIYTSLNQPSCSYMHMSRLNFSQLIFNLSYEPKDIFSSRPCHNT